MLTVTTLVWALTAEVVNTRTEVGPLEVVAGALVVDGPFADEAEVAGCFVVDGGFDAEPAVDVAAAEGAAELS